MEGRESLGVVQMAWVAVVVAFLSLGASLFTMVHVLTNERTMATRLEAAEEQRKALEIIERLKNNAPIPTDPR